MNIYKRRVHLIILLANKQTKHIYAAVSCTNTCSTHRKLRDRNKVMHARNIWDGLSRAKDSYRTDACSFEIQSMSWKLRLKSVIKLNDLEIFKTLSTLQLFIKIFATYIVQVGKKSRVFLKLCKWGNWFEDDVRTFFELWNTSANLRTINLPPRRTSAAARAWELGSSLERA